MAPFATPEWIDDLAARVRSVDVDPALEITVEQRIVDDPAFAWSVRVAGGRVVVAAGENPDSTLRLSSDRATAEAIHAGTYSAQRAFLDGALRIGGDVSQLIANRAALDVVAGLVAGP